MNLFLNRSLQFLLAFLCLAFVFTSCEQEDLETLVIEEEVNTSLLQSRSHHCLEVVSTEFQSEGCCKLEICTFEPISGKTKLTSFDPYFEGISSRVDGRTCWDVVVCQPSITFNLSSGNGFPFCSETIEVSCRPNVVPETTDCTGGFQYSETEENGECVGTICTTIPGFTSLERIGFGALVKIGKRDPIPGQPTCWEVRGSGPITLGVYSDSELICTAVFECPSYEGPECNVNVTVDDFCLDDGNGVEQCQHIFEFEEGNGDCTYILQDQNGNVIKSSNNPTLFDFAPVGTQYNFSVECDGETVCGE